MGRNSTIPTLFDNVLSFSIANLKKYNYLKFNHCNSGNLTWSRNGNKTGALSISVNTLDGNSYLELDYNFNDKPVRYRIELITKPSNLGKGVVWYFVCPVSGKQCRKLYLKGGKFIHRQCCNGYFYEKQTYSKKNRQLSKNFEYLFAADKVYVPYFKTIYKGKPTKRYLKLDKLVRKAKTLTMVDFLK